MKYAKLIAFMWAGIFFLSNLFQDIQAQSFSLSGVSDLVPVFNDGYKLPEKSSSVSVFGIRGEVISGQLVVQADKDLTNVKAELSDLQDQRTGETIPASVIEWNFVGSIPITKNAPNQPSDAIVRTAPARFPDYLMAEKQLDIPSKSYQAIWLTISIPESVPSGNFTGNIKVTSRQDEQSLPLNLTVYPLNMPEERHLKVTEWYTTGHFEKFHGISEKYSDAWFDMLAKYADNMVKHRQNVFEVPMNSIKISKMENGSLNFDFTRFDQIARVFWNTGKMDYLETGELTKFGEEAWFSTQISFRDFTVEDKANGGTITIPGEEMIPYLMPALENHLRRMGWLDKTLFHIKDEPTIRNVQAWKEASSLVHKYAPDLTRLDAIETTYLFDDIEIAVPKLDHLGAWYDTYENARRHGTELWMYTVGIYQAARYPNKTIDMPVIDNRILHWLNYKYDLSGFLHWGWNQWYSDDPFNVPGMHVGDGWHVYPARDGILNSLRWEEMRNGIQDYEYFWLLEKKIRDLKDSLGSHFTWIDPEQRGKEIASEVAMDLLHHSDDPINLYKARKELIGEILNFDSSPKIYIQTTPPVNSGAVREGSYLVEVFGWTEEGTSIEINGEKIEPDNRGMFLRNFSLSEEKNSVTVEAQKGRDHKTIVRDFVMKR